MPTPCVALDCRNDAGLAAAELALAVEEHTLATGAIDTVGTTGIMEVAPNAVNSVPREARLGIGGWGWGSGQGRAAAGAGCRGTHVWCMHTLPNRVAM